ncbi:MAG: alginate export family protein [Opitutaceae bacterium]|nr:alginate export family protein [Opitutaceae bacterium]
MRPDRLLLALCAGTSAFAAQPTPAAAPRDPRPPSAPYRVEEDWTFLRDPHPSWSTDYLDPLKYVPVGPADWKTSLTFGGEIRHRYEYYRNDLWGALPRNDPDGYHLLRAMLHADLRVGDHARAYVELKSGLVHDKQAATKPPEEDRLDLHQAFVEWHGDSPALADTPVLLRLGRQELNYGSARLITFRDGPNVRQSFDAALARLSPGAWKIDAFYGRPVETDPGTFDDATNDGQLIYGLYGVTPLPALKGAHLDLYVLGYDRDTARFISGIGNEERYSAGARFWGRRAALDYNFEALWQWGTFRSDDIRAWTVASDTGYTVATLPTAPRLYLKANIISGDRQPGDGELNTFNALYPRGAYFGDIGLIGPANLINLHPGISGKLSRQWTYNLDTVFYWREQTADGVYNAGGALLRAPGGSDARYIGTQADAVVTWTYDRHLSVEFSYAHFWAGAFLEETGPSEDVDYVSILTRFRF